MRLVDLTGQTFGRLTVLRRVENSPGSPANPSGYPQYECQCSCPNKTIIRVRGGNLKNGHIQSCGCLRREISSARMKANDLAHERSRAARFVDLTGKVFGRLTVIKRVENGHTPNGGEYGFTRYLCRCVEGNECIVSANNLVTGRTQSCGCLMRERARECNLIWTDEENKILSVLNSMHTRCCNPNCSQYRDYGARGIYICQEWSDPITGKRAFVEWAKANGYAPGLTIDRIDNDGPYAPWNCRWVDRFVQANNSRKNIIIEIDGTTHTLAEWVRMINGDYKALYAMWQYKNQREEFKDFVRRSLRKETVCND